MKETNNVFYVYEHWRPDTNKCFYVGKGKNRRAWDLKQDRNMRHMSVVSQLISMGLCVDVRLIANDLSNKTACSMEIDRIAFYGMENLTNANKGGGGQPTHTYEARLKIGIASKGRRARLGFKASEETKEKQRVVGLASIDNFKKYSHLGPKAMARPVMCLDDGKIFESAKAAERFYGASNGSITAVCLKKKYRFTVGARRFEYLTKAIA